MADAAREERDPREAPTVHHGIVVAVVAIALVLVAIALAVLWVTYRSAIGPIAAITPPVRFPAPGLGFHQGAERRDQEAEKESILGSYGWIDRDAGIVRVPIGEAMKLVAGRGQAAFDPLPDLGGRNPPAARPGG
ncbi:MAG TPA: hypothetical protein VHD15_02730 [Hyphomicrobiales bacterium]|nr:hypothetical protein [Hyphomicrobiales bacterium]